MTGQGYDRRKLIILLPMELRAELCGQSTVTVAKELYRVSHMHVLSKHCLGCYITYDGKRQKTIMQTTVLGVALGMVANHEADATQGRASSVNTPTTK